MNINLILRVLPIVFNALQSKDYNPIHPLDYGEKWGDKPCYVRGIYWFTEHGVISNSDWELLEKFIAIYPSCYIAQDPNLDDYSLVQTMPMGSYEANSYVKSIPDRYRAKKAWSKYLLDLT